jgi:hypothetical protein
MIDTRLQAIEAARGFAYNFEDMMAKAAIVEAYLLGDSVATRANTTTALTPVSDIELPEHSEEVEEIANLAGIVPDESVHVHLEEQLRDMAAAIVPEALEGAVTPVFSDGFNPSDFLVERYRITGPRLTEDDHLRPLWIKIAEAARSNDVVINSSRGAGLTTFMIAFARERAAQGKHVLLVTSNYRLVTHLAKEIDDASVKVMTFEALSNAAFVGEYYDYILIDNAAHIPFSIESRLLAYIHAVTRKEVIAPFDHDDMIERSAGRSSHYHAGSSIMITPPYLIVGSTPATEQGLFHRLWTTDDCALKIAVASRDWMHPDTLTATKAALGPERFANLHDNAFRPVQE